MIKVLGVFVGIGDIEEANWRPRINAAENTLNLRCQRHLSYRGKSLVINALALSWIWYVASPVHMPDWVLRELNTLIFKFFWKGKRDLFARTVVCQPFLLFRSSLKFGHSMCNGPGVLLLAQLCGSIFCTFIFGIVSVHLLWMFFLDLLTLTLVFLPPFYHSFLSAWRAADGGFSARHGSLSIGCSSGLTISLVSAISMKSVYTFLLSENLFTPHCVVKFAPIFGPLY